MATKNVTIRMDEDLRRDAEALFDELGMTLSGAITVFLRQAVREQRIPFEIQKEPRTRTREQERMERFLAYIEQMQKNKNQ